MYSDYVDVPSVPQDVTIKEVHVSPQRQVRAIGARRIASVLRLRDPLSGLWSISGQPVLRYYTLNRIPM
jgi:hypothetical protein